MRKRQIFDSLRETMRRWGIMRSLFMLWLWIRFLWGFMFPLMWYYATFLYLGNHYRKDPRERAGLAASAIAAMGSSVLLFIIVAIRLLA